MHGGGRRCSSTFGFSPDSRRLVTGSFDGTARVWDVRSGQSRLALAGHSNGVWCAVLSPDAKTIATGGGDRAVRLWDAANGAAHGTARLGDVRSGAELSPFYQMSGVGGLLTIAFSPDGKLCAAAGGAMGPEKAEAGVHLIDLETQREVRVFEGHARMVRSVAFSGDGTRVASASLDGKHGPRTPGVFLAAGR